MRNRIIELRKEQGLSQEALLDKELADTERAEKAGQEVRKYVEKI